MQPIMLARTISTLDHMLKGRLTINIISSDFPGQKEDSAFRYQRSREVVEILKQAWTQDKINYSGSVYDFKDVTTVPVQPYQTGGPLLYFGGYSPSALELCGEHCDVYLMWPEKKDALASRMKFVNEVAQKYNRTLDYGLRVHVIVRDTEKEAQEYAEYITSKLDDEYGKMIRERALDSGSLGVSHQAASRELADKYGYIEPNLWTGVGRARSGCGAALVGSTDQVLSKIEEYRKMGMRSFIFSGYPHINEAKHFGSRILPQLKTCSLPHAYGRIPQTTPATPLGIGARI
jgi:alkanesulfonate monooxygenase